MMYVIKQATSHVNKQTKTVVSLSDDNINIGNTAVYCIISQVFSKLYHSGY